MDEIQQQMFAEAKRLGKLRAHFEERLEFWRHQRDRIENMIALLEDAKLKTLEAEKEILHRQFTRNSNV